MVMYMQKKPELLKTQTLFFCSLASSGISFSKSFFFIGCCAEFRFHFNLMFAFSILVFSGESGLGKSTLINSLFLTDLYSGEYPGPSHRIKKTVQVYSAKISFLNINTCCLFLLNFALGTESGKHLFVLFF